MKTRNNQTLGAYGEGRAVLYLSSLGYRILEKNFRKNYMEIDIVALDSDTLVIVEVKTRKGNSYGRAEESITNLKLSSLKKAALYYRNLHPNIADRMRIDLVCLNITGNGGEEINLYKNITL